MVPEKTDKGVGKRDAKGGQPIKTLLMSRLLMWTTGAQTEKRLGACVEYLWSPHPPSIRTRKLDQSLVKLVPWPFQPALSIRSSQRKPLGKKVQSEAIGLPSTGTMNAEGVCRAINSVCYRGSR